ncbi:phage replication protein [Serratia marcescens]|uniref:replication endonuclease n=1 Tax=Serratia TaxID=613 RepID=UPI0018D94530|nr:replication endonuclease [Serratia ureilytica]MBH2945036.1 replication endonuclease [Serratia ureilytica]BEL83526.1 phage replication protein [Serratia marcescens]
MSLAVKNRPAEHLPVNASAIQHAAYGDYAYPWNAPRRAIGREAALNRDQLRQWQAILQCIHDLPYYLRTPFLERHRQLLSQKGAHAAWHYLVRVFHRRIWPRIQQVNNNFGLDQRKSLHFGSEADSYSALPALGDKALEQLARRIGGQLSALYQSECDALLAKHGNNAEILLHADIQRRLYRQIATMARAFNIQPMHWRCYRKGKLDSERAIAALSRLTDDRWLLRRLKMQRMQWREALQIAIGNVRNNTSPYASRQALHDVKARRQSNLDYLHRCELENVATGERADLMDKVLGSIANPAIRRMELMNTLAGIETYATRNGHCGLFITLTTPARFHPIQHVGTRGKMRFNTRWQGQALTPKDGQRYLVAQWGKMRTAFKDRRLQVYGMRVVEPHHDGTPHWHLMMFTPQMQRQAVLDIMQRYALQQDAAEPGAQQHRFQSKHLNRGGATAYLAKYVAKNLDGYALEEELDRETGAPLSDTARAVSAWAATWRIPQFHPFGLPGLGVYRECRRIRGQNLTPQFDAGTEAVRAAADAGDFAGYIQAQGGANVPRSHQWVRVAREASETRNAYDEPVTKVVGIYAPHLGIERVYRTRTVQWRIVAKTLAAATPWSSGNNCGTRALYLPPAPAPSARLTPPQRQHCLNIARKLRGIGIEPQRWQLEVLARGGKIHFDGLLVQFPLINDWPYFYCTNDKSNH